MTYTLQSKDLIGKTHPCYQSIFEELKDIGVNDYVFANFELKPLYPHVSLLVKELFSDLNLFFKDITKLEYYNQLNIENLNQPIENFSQLHQLMEQKADNLTNLLLSRFEKKLSTWQKIVLFKDLSENIINKVLNQSYSPGDMKEEKKLVYIFQGKIEKQICNMYCSVLGEPEEMRKLSSYMAIGTLCSLCETRAVKESTKDNKEYFIKLLNHFPSEANSASSAYYYKKEGATVSKILDLLLGMCEKELSSEQAKKLVKEHFTTSSPHIYQHINVGGYEDLMITFYFEKYIKPHISSHLKKENFIALALVLSVSNFCENVPSYSTHLGLSQNDFDKKLLQEWPGISSVKQDNPWINEKISQEIEIYCQQIMLQNSISKSFKSSPQRVKKIKI